MACTATKQALAGTGSVVDVLSLEKEVLKICEGHEKGLTDKEIREELTAAVDIKARSQVYNNLLSRGRLQVVQRATGEKGKNVVVYKWVSAENARRLAGLSAAERMVYDLILKSKEQGQTRKDIKSSTNILNSAELKAIIERLTARGLIKEIKSVASSNKRVYIVASLEASAAHTGGPWYGDDQEFDQEFIQAIYDFSLTYIANNERVTVEMVTRHVAKSGLSNETLSDDDIRKLMYTMLHDAQIELCQPHEGDWEDDGDVDYEVGMADAEMGMEPGKRKEKPQYFRKTRPLPSARMHMEQPCFRCEIKDHCIPGSVISQTNCVYIGEWIRSAYDW